jgi:hypothetical protein
MTGDLTDDSWGALHQHWHESAERERATPPPPTGRHMSSCAATATRT